MVPFSSAILVRYMKVYPDFRKHLWMHRHTFDVLLNVLRPALTSQNICLRDCISPLFHFTNICPVFTWHKICPRLLWKFVLCDQKLWSRDNPSALVKRSFGPQICQNKQFCRQCGKALKLLKRIRNFQFWDAFKCPKFQHHKTCISRWLVAISLLKGGVDIGGTSHGRVFERHGSIRQWRHKLSCIPVF